MSFSQQLIRLRKEHQLTQAQLAEKLHLSRQAVSKWENGESQPDLDTLTALCDIFQVSADELLRETSPIPLPAAAIGLRQILLLILVFCASMLVLDCLTLIILNLIGPNFGIIEITFCFLFQLSLSGCIAYQVRKRFCR